MQYKNMVQYYVWPNCCNNCSFCLKTQRQFYSKQNQIKILKYIIQNIKYIDWENRFSYGISLIGGQLYYIQDLDIQQVFLQLIDTIIQKILKVSKNPACRYSTVTNGIYDPTFLYKVIDKIKNQVGIDKVDINFSFDLKYRFENQQKAKICLNNVNNFHKKYNYRVNVQMILTQYLIDMWKHGQFKYNEFLNSKIPQNDLTFLYPHPIKTGKILNDFFLNRSDFLKFVLYLKNQNPIAYKNFLLSTNNSCIFKYSGLINSYKTIDLTQQPKLWDGKQIINEKCGHSVLYQCYSDTDKCILCDLLNLDSQIYN